MNALQHHPFESRSTVLLVEDDHDIRVGVRNLLEDEGYKVLTATNGLSALTIIDHSNPKPSLILLDLMLPVMDGWAFATELRARPAISTIPILVISAFTEPPPPADAVAYMKKPLSPEKLLALVERYCD
jgi:CheY-like chemotaxis protein